MAAEAAVPRDAPMRRAPERRRSATASPRGIGGLGAVIARVLANHGVHIAMTHSATAMKLSSCPGNSKETGAGQADDDLRGGWSNPDGVADAVYSGVFIVAVNDARHNG